MEYYFIPTESHIYIYINDQVRARQLIYYSPPLKHLTLTDD